MEDWAVEYQLINSSAEHAFGWLKDNQKDDVLLAESREDLEKALLAKDDNLINLGLALFGASPEVGHTLFISGGTVIKRAALAGRTVRGVYFNKSWVLKEDVLPALLSKIGKGDDEANDELLHALFNNPLVDDDILIKLFERKEPYDSLDDDKWLRLIARTVRNDRLSTPYDSSWMDGWDEYKYNLVFTSAWHLFGKLPKNKLSATVLEMLGDKLVADKPHDMDVMEVIKTWSIDDDHEDSDHYARMREALVKIIGTYNNEFKELKDSEDLALRKGYYRHMEYVNPDDIKVYFEKDGKDFVEAALYNKRLYSNDEVRSALSQACWDVPDENHYMDFPNYFNAHCDRWSAEHPEWFRDSWSGEVPFEEIEDPEVRKEKRLEYLNSQMTEVHRKLLGKKTEDHLPDEYGENSLFDDLRGELRTIGEYMGGIYRKRTIAYGWGIAGLAVGYILARL